MVKKYKDPSNIGLMLYPLKNRVERVIFFLDL